MKCCRIMTVPTPPVLEYYLSTIVNDCPDVVAVRHVAALEFITLALMQSLCADELGVVGFQCYDLRMGQGGWGELVPLAVGVRHRIND